MADHDQSAASQDSSLEDISEAELLDLAITNRLIDLHTAMPAKVTAYDRTKQTVEVVPQLDRHLPDGQGGWLPEHLPKLNDIPVAFPRAGGFALLLPIQAGDFGLVVFSERSIAMWRATAQQGDPGDIGMHTLDGAVFIPGLYPDSMAATSASTSNMVIGADVNTQAQIEITPTEIHLGAGANKGVARAGDDLSATTDSRSLLEWAGNVESAITTLGSPMFSDNKKTFNYDGSDPGETPGPGRAGRLGTIHGASSHVKAED